MVVISFKYIAPVYNFLVKALGIHYPERVIRLLVLRGENRSCEILDIGGGTGLLAERIISKNPGPCLHFTVLDPSCEMLKKVPEMENIKTVQGRGEDLPFENNTFDRITVIETLHHSDDPASLFREAFRVLKPGGIMVVQEPDQKKFLVKIIIGLERIFLRSIKRVDEDLIKKWGKEAGFIGRLTLRRSQQIFWKGKKRAGE